LEKDMKLLLLILLAFVIGSIPFGAIIGKMKGVALRQAGSGNIGATNVLRTVGVWPALLTLLGDIAKGMAAVAIGKYFSGDTQMVGVIGFAAILGHTHSIFLGFRGGKGVATSIGVLLLYVPKAAIVTISIWLIVAVLTRYSSLGALVALGLLPISIVLFDFRTEKLIFSIMVAILILLKHSSNIKRLIKGEETRIGSGGSG
jgi:glycerol-3-phosphate acyltransferase PlsY